MWIITLLAIALSLLLFYRGQSFLGWAAPLGLLLVGWMRAGIESPVAFGVCAGVWAVAAIVGGVPPVRQAVLTKRLLPLIQPILPRMSETERVAIEAGTVWWEAEFFTGRPSWGRLLNFHPQALTAEEQAFLDGPVEKVCRMTDDWEVNKNGDLPPDVWRFVRNEGFMGMIIPKEFGGLGFSAAAHSAVVTKLASHSVALAVTVMVPNSLGPAELLMHYGTDDQKKHYLPRLARGEDVPAFALTEPGAGSDAGSMTSRGVVCQGLFEGREQLGIRLDWDKRYITLAPVATVLGLAFKLEDPDGLLGGEKDLGITCALVPTDLPGVDVGKRHDPLGVPFLNGPTTGKDVFVPIDWIIGGRAMAGKGWLMLMQSLAAGRGISLPSMASGSAKVASRVTGAYATIREQFGTAIGRFEGVQEPLARIAAMTYAMDAARVLTAGAVDAGERPSVASAIVKCYLTETMRDVVNDAMDIVGGAGICRGPRNALANGYAALPIGITVEGANILTRSMIIFGQGAIRCHPFVQDEMAAAFAKDVARFDKAFFGHVGFVFQNVARSFLLGLTGGALATSPVSTRVAPYYKKLTRTSAAFALLSDVAMGTLGGALKRKEAITGRLADSLAWMFLASAALKRFNTEGSKDRELPLVRWVVEHALHQCQEAMLGVLQNLPLRPAAWAVRLVAFPLGRTMAPPSDRLTQRVAALLLDGNPCRDHLTQGMYVPTREDTGLGLLELALEQIVRAQPVRRKIHEAIRVKRLEKRPAGTLAQRAVEAKVITEAESQLLDAARQMRAKAVAVDAFAKREFAEMAG